MDTNNTPIVDLIKNVAVVISFLLGAFNTAWLFRRDRRVVKVRMGFRILTNAPDDTILQVKVVNAGQRDVTVTSIELELPDNLRSISTGLPRQQVLNTPLPATLKDGQEASAYFDCAGLKKTLLSKGFKGEVIVTPICGDSIGKTYRGRSDKINLC